MGIGPKKVAGNTTLDRSSWDTNPFYLWFKYQEGKNITAGFLSSSDYFLTESRCKFTALYMLQLPDVFRGNAYERIGWTLTSTKSGDGFDFTGEYTGKLAAVSNVYNYPTDACWTVNIYNHIVKAWTTSPTDFNRWTVKGSLTPAKVDIVIDQLSMEKGIEYHNIFTYEGTANPGTKGARLVTTEDFPTTDLALKTTATVNATANNTNATDGTSSNIGASGLIVGGNVDLGIMSVAAFVVGIASYWL